MMDKLKAVWTWLGGFQTTARAAVLCALVGFVIGGAVCRSWRRNLIDADAPSNTFGWRIDVDQVEATMSRLPQPRFADSGKNLEGSWDGKKNIGLWTAARKVLGHDIPVQFQTRGTCVSRAASAVINYGQATAIASGSQIEWHNSSHAFIYACSKEVMNDLGPANRRGNDGLTGASAAEAVTKFGSVSDEEAGDNDRDDKLAIEWAVHGAPPSMKEKGRERLVGTVSRISTFREAADAITNGYAIVICSQYGFEPVPATRDKDGFLRNSGNWPHAMAAIGVVNVNGRRGLVILNSWDANWVRGPNPLDMPAGCFCADEKTVDGMLGGRMRDSFVYSNFNGFPKRDDLDWRVQLPVHDTYVAAAGPRSFDQFCLDLRRVAGLTPNPAKSIRRGDFPLAH